ncbi:hypothetical protein MY04_1884 [Flammeovirga sp. MY04]|uniref:hypothetical protein n=1 Tax=Flammeovirga sp. MY04 TaxID=1191459 RepID=UPI0008063D19|nr:hypothetical protein [Flammeovirga sp. MY04]ANQ49258.1 hypothetical protein MY04_1884 [Flammeovirga sp. MY04]
MNIGFSYQDSLKFEVIFYSVKDDMPYEVLNQKRLFWGISKDEIDNGKVELNLWKENIYMEKPFFVSIKMIETIKGKTYGVMLNANAFGKSKFKKKILINGRMNR